MIFGQASHSNINNFSCMALLGWLRLVQKYFTASQDSLGCGTSFLVLEIDLVDPFETQRWSVSSASKLRIAQ
jgi:hypothetical protein